MNVTHLKTICWIYNTNRIDCLRISNLTFLNLQTLDGYTTIHFDRNKIKTDRSTGGGLCLMVNDKWATNFCVRERISTRSYEILTVSFRPHYLPRELAQVTVVLVYIPGPGYTGAASRACRRVLQQNDQ